MRCNIPTGLVWILAASAAFTFGEGLACAEGREDWGDRDHRGPVYQRRAFDGKDKHGHGHHRGRRQVPHYVEPSVSSGWFQRPYPYHLDYYKMRYGGSYAPYFGNLYGPPQVVTAPPYYGPYYGGGYEYAQPPGYGPNGMIYEAPVDNAGPVGPAIPPAAEDLPGP
jgi:hypothetical protein